MGVKPIGNQAMVVVDFHITVEMLAFIKKESEERKVSRALIIRELLEKGKTYDNFIRTQEG
jgi:hypothetical protein